MSDSRKKHLPCHGEASAGHSKGTGMETGDGDTERGMDLLFTLDKFHSTIEIHSRQGSDAVNSFWRGGINTHTQRGSMAHIPGRDLQIHE
jgi:hypothetical protein